MKKLSAIILSMAIILCASTTAVAIDATVEDLELIMDNRYDCVAQEFNEYDYIQMLQNCSLDDLESAGMEKEEVDAAISQFEDALRLRSSLPEKQLLELGYSEEEIEILQAYAHGARITDAEMRAVAGTCTGALVPGHINTKEASFYYKWEWDHCPVVTLTDAAAVRWVAYNNTNIGVVPTLVDSTINYYTGNTYVLSESGTSEPGLDVNSKNITFPMNYSAGGNSQADSMWAKNGVIQIDIKVGMSNYSMDYLEIGALYGHTTFGVGAPSISISVPASISISFGGSVVTSKTGGDQVQYNALTGKMTKLP